MAFSDEELPEVPEYPALFKHMVLAIFLEGNLPRSRPSFSQNKIPVRSSPNKDGFDPTKFQAAMDVALAQLKKYRMIAEKSNRAQIMLTAYGRETDNKHRREPQGRAKIKRFDDLYTKLVVEGKKRVSKREFAEAEDKPAPKPQPIAPKPPTNLGRGAQKMGPRIPKRLGR